MRDSSTATAWYLRSATTRSKRRHGLQLCAGFGALVVQVYDLPHGEGGPLGQALATLPVQGMDRDGMLAAARAVRHAAGFSYSNGWRAALAGEGAAPIPCAQQPSGSPAHCLFPMT